MNASPQRTGRTGIFKKLSLCASFACAAVFGLATLLSPDHAQAADVRASFNPKAQSSLTNYDPEWTIRLSGDVDEKMSEKVIDKLRELNKKDPTREIEIRLNSGGGSVNQGFAMYDVMRSISNDIRTVCEGRARSMAAVLLMAGGTPGKRMAYEHCEIMMHETNATFFEKVRVSELTIEYADSKRANEKFMEIMHQHTGLSMRDLRAMLIKDIYTINTKEALKLGIIDEIIPSKPLPEVAPRALPADFCDPPERQVLQVCPRPPENN